MTAEMKTIQCIQHRLTLLSAAWWTPNSPVSQSKNTWCLPGSGNISLGFKRMHSLEHDQRLRNKNYCNSGLNTSLFFFFFLRVLGYVLIVKRMYLNVAIKSKLKQTFCCSATNWLTESGWVQFLEGLCRKAPQHYFELPWRNLGNCIILPGPHCVKHLQLWAIK